MLSRKNCLAWSSINDVEGYPRLAKKLIFALLEKVGDAAAP